MNRDCGCKHHARNIMIDDLGDNFNWTDREKNVQNALELLAGARDLEQLSKLINSLTSNLTTLINLENQIKVLQNKLDDVISSYNLYGTVDTDGIYVNPYYNGNEDESYYYRTIFWDNENQKLLFPDLNGDGVVDFTDYNIAFYLKYYINDAYQKGTEETLKDYLAQSKEERNNTDLANIKDLTPEFSQLIISLLNKERNLTDYDLQIISDYIKDVTTGKLIYTDDKDVASVVEMSEDGFNDYVNFKNPLLFLQWPDINEDGRINAQDEAAVLVISAEIGAGNSSTIPANQQKWVKDYVNARLAAELAVFVADSGAGNITNDEKGWAEFLIQKGGNI